MTKNKSERINCNEHEFDQKEKALLQILDNLTELFEEEGKKINPKVAEIYCCECEDMYDSNLGVELCDNEINIYVKNPGGPPIERRYVPKTIWEAVLKRVQDEKKKNQELRQFYEDDYRKSRLSRSLDLLMYGHDKRN